MRKRLARTIDGHDHARGRAGAPVTLVEYGDYECPSCGGAHHELGLVLAHFEGDLLCVFRHFPLTQSHPHALAAARAAEAAAVQGRFWEMHELLFTHQYALETAHLLAYAGQIGLDVEQFRSDFESEATLDRVKEDFDEGVRNGVNGTPSLYVNGLRYEGQTDARSLIAAIETRLRAGLRANRAAPGPLEAGRP